MLTKLVLLEVSQLDRICAGLHRDGNESEMIALTVGNPKMNWSPERADK